LKHILWFSDVDKNDAALVGAKGANLGELTHAGLSVPPGFVVTTQAYFDFLDSTNLTTQIKNLLKNLNPEDGRKLNEVALKIQKMILAKPMPVGLTKEITRSYKELYTKGASNIFVAVRSSATTEGSPMLSFAGQQKTFLNVAGSSEVVKAVKGCWASLYEARAIYYRIVNKLEKQKVGIAVPVQKMVQAEKSGTILTTDPMSCEENTLIIEAGWGLGEAIASGAVIPDHYELSKDDLKIFGKTVSKQNWKIVRGERGDKHVAVPLIKRAVQKLTDQEILAVAELGRKIEEHYKTPQNVEWAIESTSNGFSSDKLYILQSKPIVVKSGKLKVESQEENYQNEPVKKDQPEIILKGLAASLGLASGPVRILHKPSDLNKVQRGDVIVTEMATPDFLPIMRMAAAIVTDTGGRTSHPAIMARELGLPCVVGAGVATHVLKENQLVSVDGAKGLIYKGKVDRYQALIGSAEPTDAAQCDLYGAKNQITATKIYVNLGEPETAELLANLPCDGVGLVRAEFMITEIGEHPRSLVNLGKSDYYINKMAEGLRTICAAFNPRPVVYRASDLKTNEYRHLKGGAEFEPLEANPTIGYRGAARYIQEPDLFKLELEAIKKVRHQFGFKNLWLMIPYVRTVEEMEKVIVLIKESGLEQSHDFKLWMMAEVPSNVILMERFCALGIDGVSIGTNDLTQLTLGVDRDNMNLTEEFDERDDAVKLSISHIIKTCRRHHVSVSICGQAVTNFPEIAELVIKEGITSVSVSPDAVSSTRRLVASIEKKILLSRTFDNM
jgi:pyruvate,water dikinase